MASHTRELLHLLGECLGDADFDSTTSISRAQGVKNKFIARDFPVGAEAATNNHNSELDLIHTYDALVTVCNEVIELSGKHADRVDFIEDDGEARLAWKFIALSVERDPARMEKVVDAALAHKAVDFLYCAARPRQFDMFVHLSAAEMFFIDGDSLLMAALSSQHVDWDLIQPLHVFHNAQALLHRLHSRGARFHVVFFDQATWFWEKAPAKLLLRENLRLALTNVARDHPATELVVKTFPSFHDATFAAYVAEYDPEFILMSDGEQLGALNEMQLLFTNKVMDEKRRVGAYRSLVDDEAHGAKVSFYLRCFLAWCIAHSVKVAYSSRILSKENAIVVFAVAAEGLQQTRATKMESATVELAAALEHEVQLPSVSEESIAASKDSGLSFREQIITGALHAFLAAKTRTPAELQLVQALAVTAYSASMVDASLRAQLAMRSPAIAAFLTDLAPFVLQILHERGCAKARGAEFDILDGHLLAAMVHHLRTNPLSALLDEQGVGDVNYSWQQLIKDDAATVGATPLDLLPEVVFDERRAPVKCPHFTHELVDALAAKFGVEGHVSDRAFPASLGCADLLSGWKITEPFDEMNDVVDAYVVEESQRNMKDTERRRLARLETAFVADAAQQATSMGLNGFTAGQLALVCSDDDEPDAAAEKGSKAKQHAGQKNKKVRRNKDSIKESANIRDADNNLRKRIDQMEVVLKATDLQMDRTNNDDRKQAMDYLDASIKDMQQKRFGEKFDPGEDIGDANKTLPLKTAMWRVLVEASGMTEAVFAVHLEEGGAKRGAKKSISAPEDGVFALSVIKGLTANLSDASGSDWGPLQRLHLAKPDMMADEAVFYLFWVYLSQVQAHLTARLRCRVVKLLLDNWKVERTRARNRGETPDIHVGIPLFIYCHHQVLPIIRDRGILFSGEDLDIVRSALYHFEFDKMYYAKVDRAIAQWQQKEITSAPSNRPLEKLLEQSPELIQLMHMGHLLERPIIPHKDYRVVFNPDGWQRELLDIVDQRGSAVVCAPTSAGKTFISYYCMYNALKTSNTKVVVYVAPNRALINQAVADVCARYGKKEYVVAGKNVYGVHGGADYHRFHDTCQILVTLPEVLETLLLSPKYESWVERLDYVILDEIHTMESSGNGDVWERVLSLLPCPFVALSATLGETSQLCGWLNRVQSRLQGQIEASKTKQRRRDFVVHEIPRDEPIQRWNDIKKYIYLPPPGFHHPLRKLTAKYEPRNIKDLHPLSILTLDQLRRGFPPDISLVPSEVVQLHEKMVEQFTQHIWIPDWQSLELIADLKAQLDELMPETYFSKVNYITQRHARQYESEVKNAFSYWAYLSGGGDTDDAERPPEAFFEAMLVVCDAILKAFSQHLRAEEESLEKYASDSALLPVEQRVGNTHPPQSKDFIASSIIDVLRELVSRDMAPTIVFSFESEDCDNLVEAIVTQLERAEDAYRQTEEFARYRVGVERKAAAKEAARKQRESTLAQKKLEKNEDGDVVRAERDVDVDGGDDDEECVVPEVLPEFTFIRYMNSGAGAAAVKECEKRGDYLAARAIKRGVGIHHAGVKGKLRRTFEVLFRSGHCGVILATETLALGVHSPCRSVVLAGDHVLLNTTQFRQMMGRAGRRGLDTLGHLIFLSVGMKKITRLMTSSMTVIKGNVQMDPISQLRLLQLHDHREHRGAKKVEEWKARVVSLAERLFVNPLFFEGRARVEGGNMEPFSIEYFQMLLGYFHKEGLHFKDRPSSLGSLLVDVMSVFRNARVGNEGFSFISMLTRKIFASAAFGEVVENFTSSETSAAVELMAYLFSVHQMCGVPLEIHRSVLSDPAVQALWKLNGRQTKQHRVVLAPLHGCVPDGVQVIDNANMFRAISGFYSELARKLKEPASTVLPYMTKKKYPLFGEAPSEDFPLCGKLRETAVAYDARDPFVAISGCGDNFVNSDDLVSTLRSGLFCDRRLLPTLDLSDGCRHDGAQVLINACIADFIRCGSQMQESNYRFTYLEKYNGLTQSESFSVLNQVERLLSNIGGLVRDGQKDQMKTLTDMDVLTKLLPEEDVEKYDAGASKILEICATLHGLREQIDKDYSAVLLRMKQAESRKKKAAAS